jgi:transposase
VQEIDRDPWRRLFTATAAVATIGDPDTFESGREFASWISKRGNVYLRTLLMHGARAIVALKACSSAGTIWAVLSHGTRFNAPVPA